MGQLSYQLDDSGTAVAQKQSGEVGAADVNIASSTAPVQVAGVDNGGNVRLLSVNSDGGLRASYSQLVQLQRGANQTAYTAGDVVGGAIQIPNIGPAGGMVALLQAHLIPVLSAVATNMTSFRVYFYNQKPVSNIADNGVWTLPVSDLPSYQTYIDVGSPAVAGASGGTTLLAKSGPTGGEPALLAPGSNSLWAYVVTNGGFTPAANSEIYNLLVQSIAL